MAAQGFFITGTDTGVGKTVTTACLLSLYRKHRLNVGVMKPIETGVDPECSSSANSDAKFLLEVCQSSDPLSEVCPVQLKTAASPFQAAKIDNRAIDIDRIINSFHQLSDKYDNLLVVGVGGLLVPLKPEYLVCDLIRDLGLPLLVVGRNTLGTLNHTLLTLRAAEQAGIAIRGVILNRTEPEENNAIESGHAGIITEFSGIPMLGEIPFLGQISEKSFSDELLDKVEASLDFGELIPRGNTG
jgi:dethiobiotin synthetase